MKFLCDRCKTRYSIGDDRVRGKILKIRCKNCANVITVREGMSPEDEGAPGDAAERARKAASAATEALAPAAAAAGPSRPANEPAAPAAGPSRAGNEPAASRGGARDPLAGVTGKRSADVDTVRGLGRSNARSAATAPRSEGPAARAAAAGPPAPAALEEEWYVSIDGEQAGPFSLAVAQRWVTQQPLDAELHCWSEGFDDWLPVDKVSHFRGLRKRPIAQSAPPPLPRATAGAPRPAPAEDEPKPLFAATMASLERGAPAMPAGLGLPPPAASPAQATPAQATPAREAPIAARGDLGIRPTNGSGPATTPLGRRPEVAAETKPDARPGVRPQAQRAPAAEVKPAGKAAGEGGREAPARAAPERPPADPFDLAEGYAGDGKTVLEAMPFDDAPVDPGRAAGSPGASAGTAPAAPAHAAPPRSDFGDDDLDIGEVSRVVNLADVAREGRGARRSSAARRAAEPAAGSTSGESGLRSTTRSTASAASLAPVGEPGVTSAPIVHAQRRGLIALLVVAMVLVLGVIAAVVLVTGSDDAPNTSLDTVQGIDTSRPDDPIAHRPVGSAGSASVAVPAPSPPIAPRPHPRPAPGTGQIAEAPPAGNPLGGDEIEDVARKHQDMTQRCYMRSQRGADTILVGDVKKIAVTLTIDREGNVSDLQLSDHAADTLGKCLAGAIRTWKFRPSAGGTFRFSLNFVSG